VGIGGEGLGPGGATEWIHAGLSAFADGRIELYEVTLPCSEPRYVTLGDGGTAHSVAVLETPRSSWWRVWVDGRPASAAYHLPGSHGIFEPTATAESWDGGNGACNGFAYRFTRVAVSTTVGRKWHPLRRPQVIEDPGLQVLRRRTASKLARPPEREAAGQAGRLESSIRLALRAEADVHRPCIPVGIARDDLDPVDDAAFQLPFRDV
jgi:hypothetical protein